MSSSEEETNTKTWYLKSKSDEDHDPGRELNEQELQRELRRAGDNVAQLLVRQGTSDWYPGKFVRKKFEKLSRVGIYIRCDDGFVDGPFTAARSIEMLREMESLSGVKAKIGIHADWISGARLLRKLNSIKKQIRDTNAKDHQQENKDKEFDDVPMVSDDDGVADVDVMEESDEFVEAHLVDDDDDIVDPTVFDDEPLVELVRTSEPISLPQNDRPSVECNDDEWTTAPQAVEIVTEPIPEDASIPTIDPIPTIQPISQQTEDSEPAPQSPIRPRPVNPRTAPKQGGRKQQTAIIGIAVMLLATASGLVYWFVIRQSSEQEVAEVERSDPDVSPAHASAAKESRQVDVTNLPKGADGSPPRLRDKVLFFPKFETTLGTTQGGRVFAAKSGRSNRIFLIGSAKLLGPAAGLDRQLRGAESTIYWNKMMIRDCKNAEAEDTDVDAKPVRLLTDVYPEMAVHGDSLMIETNGNIDFNPIEVSATLPKIGDRVWLVGKIDGSPDIIHPGRWIGENDDNWLEYRLDDSDLDVSELYGAPLLNIQHQVIGIHVATDKKGEATISVASPMRLLRREMN